MLMYEAWASFNSIKPVEVDRATDKSVYIKGNRRARVTDGYTSYFDTWDEAKAHLVACNERVVNGYRVQLERASSRLGNAKGLKKPEGA